MAKILNLAGAAACLAVGVPADQTVDSGCPPSARMASQTTRIHCELGPVLVNRTAVYKMCRMAPTELASRGFRVSCGALLARLRPRDGVPASALHERLFRWSQAWLNWSIRRPGLFYKTRFLGALGTRWRQGRGFPLFMDPLYTLFLGAPDKGVVLVYDITTVSDQEWHNPGVCRLYSLAFELLARSRCHLVATCRSTADELRLNWGIAPSRVTVLPLGLFEGRPDGKTPIAVSGAPFLLFVGNLEPRKNVPGLIRAYAASGLFASRGVRLRVIGSLPAESDPVFQLARATPGVDLMGFVDEATLAASYQECLAFVYPSFCEGFGLPLLEAMARGCVCLATIMGASPEIAGPAALYVNPYSPGEMADSLRQIVELPPGERMQMSRAARQAAAAYTWDRFYDGLAETLRREAA